MKAFLVTLTFTTRVVVDEYDNATKAAIDEYAQGDKPYVGYESVLAIDEDLECPADYLKIGDKITLQDGTETVIKDIDKNEINELIICTDIQHPEDINTFKWVNENEIYKVN